MVYRTGSILVSLLATGAGLYLVATSPAPETATGLGRLMIEDSRDAAALLFALGAFVLTWSLGLEPGRRSSSRHLQNFWLLSASVLFVYACRVAIQTKTTILPWPDGQRFFWLDDDMMISMRYARNQARGHGLVWNPGEPPVEGFTNFLWTLIMSAPHLIGLPDRLASAPIIALNILLGISALGLSARLAVDWGVRPALVALGALLLAANRWFIHWTVSGGEGVLLANFVLLAALGLTRATRSRPAGAGVGLALAGALLTRADALAVFIGFLPALVWLLPSRRVRLHALVIPLAVFLAQLAFRRAYYGQWLPNTYYLKSVDLPLKTPMGVHYSIYLFFYMGSALILSLGALAAARSPRARALALVPWAHIAYVALAGGDELPEMRFYVPILPILIAGAMAGAEVILHAAGPRWRPGAAAGRGGAAFGWIALGLGLTLFRSLATPHALAELGRERGEIEKNNVRLGLILEKNTAPGARIAHYWAGAAPYFSNRPAIDLLGKSDPHIAHQPAHPGQWPPGHNKYDFEHSLGLEPDVIVTALPLSYVDEAARRAEPARETYPAIFEIYDAPEFRANYLPGAANVDLSRDFHGIFVRKGSTRALPPEKWTGERP